MTGVDCTTQDITDKKAHKQHLQEAAHLASIRELAASVASEINNSLTVTADFAEVLLDKDLPPDLGDQVQRIYPESQRAAKVISNLLSFAGKYGAERRCVDVTNGVTRAVVLKVYRFTVSDITIAFDFPKDVPYTMADEHQLQQVFLNVIVNAKQAIKQAHCHGQTQQRQTHDGETEPPGRRHDGRGRGSGGGRGFFGSGWPHVFGLRTMRDYTETLGGFFEVKSTSP